MMKRHSILALSVAGVMTLVTMAAVHAQQPAAGHDMSNMKMPMPAAKPAAKTAAKPAAKASTEVAAVPEIFCPTMKTGQLCSHGTGDALKLTGEKYDKWVESVRKYNKAVDVATVQLQADVKSMLTPQQNAELQRWFALGLNPQMNDLLLQASRTKPANGTK